MIRVKSVHANSLAAELGIQPGTELVSLNGRELHDFLDWEFLTADEEFVLLARDPEGVTTEYDIERPEGLPMGVELEPPRIRRCANRCDFCFVDGNPVGMRNGLYIRDDDYRLSFRHGNFATLTNLKPHDLRRIFEYRLSPLYVSVHATDQVIRRRLLRNPLAPDVLSQLRDLAQGGICCHTQIVLQPGVNDGDVLVQSLADLYELGTAILSVSVVPVGLTEFSKHHLVRQPSREECQRAIAVLEEFALQAVNQRGHHWAYGSDELYLVADRALPPADRYDGFEQVENGVGSVRYLQQQLKDLRVDLSGHRVAVLTGTAMGALMPQVLDKVREVTGAEMELMTLENSLFGRSVTTAGLLPGRAFQAVLAHRSDLDLALLPAEAVSEGGVFIDDVSLERLVHDAPVPIRVSYNFADALSELEGE